jgi:hypothetical protein
MTSNITENSIQHYLYLYKQSTIKLFLNKALDAVVPQESGACSMLHLISTLCPKTIQADCKEAPCMLFYVIACNSGEVEKEENVFSYWQQEILEDMENDFFFAKTARYAPTGNKQQA